MTTQAGCRSLFNRCKRCNASDSRGGAGARCCSQGAAKAGAPLPRFARVSQVSATHPASGWTLFSDAASRSLHSNPRRRVLLPVFCQQRETEAQRIKRQACLRSLGKWCGRGCGEQVCVLTLNGDQSGQETWEQRWGLTLKSGARPEEGSVAAPGSPAGWPAVRWAGGTERRARQEHSQRKQAESQSNAAKWKLTSQVTLSWGLLSGCIIWPAGRSPSSRGCWMNYVGKRETGLILDTKVEERPQAGESEGQTTGWHLGCGHR